MKSLAVATAFLATSWVFGAGVDLELRSAKTQLLPFEPVDLQLFLVNHGSGPVSVMGSTAFSPRLRIQTNDGWLDCRSSLAVCGAVSGWKQMTPGTEVRLGPLPDICPWRGGETYRDMEYWGGIPGHQVFQAETQLAGPSDVPDGIATPGNAFTGVLTSNIVSIDVIEPSGMDAQALAWARDHNDTPMSWKAVKFFPSSYYTALALVPYIDIGKSDPSRVRAEMSVGASSPGVRSRIPHARRLGQPFRSRLGQLAHRARRTHPARPPEGPVRGMAKARDWSQPDRGRKESRRSQADWAARQPPRHS